MRIALVSPPRDPIVTVGPQRGSVAIVLDALARRLASRHEVVVLAPRAPGQVAVERSPADYRIIRPAVPFFRWRRLTEGLSWVLPGTTLSFARDRHYAGYRDRLARALRSLETEVVHVMTLAQWLPHIARAAPQAACVLHLHDELYLHLDREVAARRLAAAAAIVTVSSWLATRLAARFPQLSTRIHPIGNGVDLGLFTPPPHVASPSGGTGRLLFVGRISPEKGVHVLLEAFARLAAQRSELELELVGEPGLMPRPFLELLEPTPALRAALAFYGSGPLDRLRRQLVERGPGYLKRAMTVLPEGARRRVVFAGPLPQERLAERYRNASLLVAPAVWNEVFGLPVAEAMASGLPCVVSRAGAPPELIGAGPDGEGEAGLAVPPGDPEALASAIARLLDDPSRRRAMAERGRQRAERLLSWDAVVERLDAVYRCVRAVAPPR